MKRYDPITVRMKKNKIHGRGMVGNSIRHEHRSRDMSITVVEQRKNTSYPTIDDGMVGRMNHIWYWQYGEMLA